MRRRPTPWRLTTSAALVTLLVVGAGFLVTRSTGARDLLASAAGSPRAARRHPAAVRTAAPTAPTAAAPPVRGTEPFTVLRARPTAAAARTPQPAQRHQKQLAQRRQQQPRKQHRMQHRPAPPPQLDFTISSFNALGASHTVPGGTHPTYAPGPERARWAAGLLAAHGVEVVGFQELQAPQLSMLERVAPGYAFYPGFSQGRLGTENSIAWRTDTWQLVRANTVSIPYFNGHRRAMPYVLLRNAATGLEVYVANFHNPASVPRFRDQQHWRDVATGMEISLVNTLHQETGLPVFVTGDMNERDEYFCRVTAGTGMVAAAGGSNTGSCAPPRPIGIDWIFGTPGVQFSGYTVDRSPLVQRTTDHPVVISQVHLTGPSAGR
ncbi:MAG: endonuclease/exonuclease/phosphatase family protein [Nocardioidaceae bacterium]